MLVRLTLTPNRSTPKLYTRLIKYVRQGDRVIPYVVTRSMVQQLAWSAIDRSDVFDEADQAWREREDELYEVKAAEWRAYVESQRKLDVAKRLMDAHHESLSRLASS